MKLGAYLAERRGSLAKDARLHIGKPTYMGRNIVSFELDEKMPDAVLRINQEIIPETHRVQMTIRAKSYEVMSAGFDYMWNRKLVKDIGGDTMELNLLDETLTSSRKNDTQVVISDIGFIQALSDWANNHINSFYIAVFAALLLTSALAWKVSKNDKD